MKKLLSCFLSLILVFSAVPMVMLTASADVVLPETYGNDAEFVALISGKSSVTLDKDYVLTEPVNCSISTLSLNGFTITYNPSAGNESANVITSTSAITVNVDTIDTAYEKANGTFVNYGTGYFFKSSTVTLQGKGSYGDGRTYGDLAVNGNLMPKTNSTYYHYGNLISTGKTSLNGDTTKIYGNIDTKNFYFERVVEIQGYLHTTGTDVNLGKCNPYSGHCQTIYFTGTDTYNGYTIFCEGNATYAFNTEKITLNTNNGRNILKKDMYVGGNLNVTWFGHTELGFSGKVVVDGNVKVNNYQAKKSSNHPDVTTPKNITFANLVCEGQSLQLTENYHKDDVENVVSVYDSGEAVTLAPYARLENIIQVKIDDNVIYSGKKENANLVLPENSEIEGYSDGETLYLPGQQVTFDENTNLTTIIGTITDSDFVIDTADKTYTSNEITTEILSQLELGDDYTVQYENNVNVGTATITITGINNYYGTVVATFQIVKKTIEETDFVFDTQDKVYTKEQVEPVVSSSLPESDYVVSYKNNVNVGTATITVEGKNNCQGTVTKTFSITEKEITADDFVIDVSDKVYTGAEITTQITSDLLDENYEIAYSNNVELGTATVVITGVGNYKGQVTASFKIVEITITDDMFNFDLADKVYTGKAYDQVVTADDLVENVDYTVEYKDNVNAGSATVVVKGIGNYAGEISKTFEITPKAITNADFTVDTTDKIYTGEEIIAEITTDLEDSDYTVVCADNVNVGTATLTIQGIGNYKEQIEYTFNITPKTLEEEMFVVAEFVAYTGQEVAAQITTDLEKDVDFEVEYKNNINVGVATVVITGIGNYIGKVESSFNITTKAITTDDFTVDLADKVYTGEEIIAEITTDLEDGDYTVVYADNVNVGVATLKIIGVGNYEGEVEFNFNITPKSITTDDFTVDTTDKVYTGAEIETAIESSLENVDYTVEYKDNLNVGSATVTIKGVGNYTSTLEFTFEITPKVIEKEWFAVENEFVYTGKEVAPEITTELKSVDYTVEYKDNVNVGSATVTIKGIGNYTGTLEFEFEITPKAITNDDFTVDTTNKVYTGNGILPTISTNLLVEKDYIVICENNVNVGTATLTIQGIGNYNEQIEYTFNITPKTITTDDFTVDLADKVYTGEKIVANITTDLELGADYTVQYKDNVNVGTATVVITGIGNYAGETVFEFKIVQKAITELDFTVDTTNKVYTGAEITTDIKTNLKNTDYTAQYKNNVNVGSATVTIKGVGNYKGTLEFTFKITPKTVQKEWFEVVKEVVYTGKAVTPEITTELKSADYTAQYKNNVNVGTATVTIKGLGNYTGEVELTFAIAPKAITSNDFVVDTTNKVYTGNGILPTISTNLLVEKDYTIVCENNVNVGTATVTIKGSGNYTGQLSYKFNITQKTITNGDFVVDTNAKVYTGAEITTQIDSTLVVDKDYTVKYSNNVNVGTATVVIAGIGNYAGEIFYEFAIDRKLILKTDFTVDTSTKIYNGKAFMPTVSSNLVLNKDYIVTYSNNVKVGTATVTINGIGNYTGETKFAFEIEFCKHQTTEIVGKVNSTYLATGYTGDKICLTCKGLIEQGSTIKKLKLKAPKFKLISGKKQFKVKYTKVADATGFQIKYKLKGKWKTVKVNTKKNATKVIKKLKKGKYSVKVRAFVKTGKKTVYSNWAKTKKVKVK